MKKIFKAVLFFLIININSFTENSHLFKVVLHPVPTLQIGQAYEYFFTRNRSTNKKYRILSKLDWPILPAFAFNFNAELTTKHGIHFLFSGQFSLPANTGNMQDIDFTDHLNPDMLTLFSKHPAMLRKGQQYNAIIGWMMPATTKSNTKKATIFVEPCIGFRYFYYNWLATDGYTRYPTGNLVPNGMPETFPKTPVTPNTPKTPFKGNAAEYTQTIFLPNIGILLKFILPKEWEIKTLLQICPQVFSICVDNHFKKNLIYNEQFLKKGFSFHLNLSIEKKITPALNFFVNTDFSAIKSFNGKTLFKKYGKTIDSSLPGTAGTALYISNFGIGMKLTISKNTIESNKFKKPTEKFNRLF